MLYRASSETTNVNYMDNFLIYNL